MEYSRKYFSCLIKFNLMHGQVCKWSSIAPFINRAWLSFSANCCLPSLGCLPVYLRYLAKEGEDAMWGSVCSRIFCYPKSRF